MRAHCTSIQLSFQALGRRSVVADFSGGTITTDAGGLLLREVAEARRLIERFGTSDFGRVFGYAYRWAGP